MQKVIDVANFFIDLANNTDEDYMTNLRLNKLLYYAQAWSLVRMGKPLFEEEIQAWKYGPVVPEIYQKFKVCGKDKIEDTYNSYSPDIFEPDELELLLDVAREYGKYSSPELVNLTHTKDGPWDQVFSCYANKTIDHERLKKYYSNVTELPSFSLTDLDEDDFIGYRDADDTLVLPADWDDGFDYDEAEYDCDKA